MDEAFDNTPPGWIEALDEADAEIEAGLFVSSEAVHGMLRGSIARLEARAEERKHQATNRS
jgi:hypothetical protein